MRNVRKNMPEYGFSLSDIFPYKKRVADAVLIWENPYPGAFYEVVP